MCEKIDEERIDEEENERVRNNGMKCAEQREGEREGGKGMLARLLVSNCDEEKRCVG